MRNGGRGTEGTRACLQGQPHLLALKIEALPAAALPRHLAQAARLQVTLPQTGLVGRSSYDVLGIGRRQGQQALRLPLIRCLSRRVHKSRLQHACRLAHQQQRCVGAAHDVAALVDCDLGHLVAIHCRCVHRRAETGK